MSNNKKNNNNQDFWTNKDDKDWWYGNPTLLTERLKGVLKSSDDYSEKKLEWFSSLIYQEMLKEKFQDESNEEDN